jgi:hypothetical protein
VSPVAASVVHVHAGAVAADDPLPDISPDLAPRNGHRAAGGADVRHGDDTEFQTQLADVQARLLRDAAPAGLDSDTVQRAIDDTVSGYESASVRSFLAVLIERDVRNRLTLAKSSEATSA